jgi:hypothetical protein
MATFVIVHGAWGGGWSWRTVRNLIRASGHEVFTPTMTGLGERSPKTRHPRLSVGSRLSAVPSRFKPSSNRCG